MADYNPFYPPSYQPYVGYQPYQAQSRPQMMTPPTIRAEIIQVDDEQAAARYPVGAGASQMMIARDDSAIFVKTALPNGQATLDVFIKRPPAQAEAAEARDFVTRDEVTALIAEAMAAQAPAKKTKKEEKEGE